MTSLKAFLLNLLVIILAMTFVTPVYLMEFLKKSGVSNIIANDSKLKEYFDSLVHTNLAPIILLFANYVMIPILID